MLRPLHQHRAAYRFWRMLRLSRTGRALARSRGRHLTPAWLARHARAVLTPDPSYAFEWTHLKELLARLDLTADGFAVDLAAGDGVTSSCTLPLFRDRGWAGLAIECDPVSFALLAHAYRPFSRVQLARRRVTPANAAALFEEFGVPRDFTVLNIDLDSYDLAVAASILTRFRPLVIDIEVNEKIPPPIRFCVNYTRDFRWDEGHCYGCSLSAARDVLGAAGYRLEGLEYNNAFFVREDAAERHDIEMVAAETAYREGYLERPDRLSLFPWNAEMEDLPGIDPELAISRLERRFRRARADFSLQLEPLDARHA